MQSTTLFDQWTDRVVASGTGALVVPVVTLCIAAACAALALSLWLL